MISGRRWHPWLVGFAVYTVLAVMFAVQKAAVFSARGIPVTPSALLLTFVGIYTWAALTPPILWLSRRRPLGQGRWRRNLPAHLLLLPAVVFVDLGSYALLDGTLLPSFPWGESAPAFLERALRLLAWGAIGDLLWYGSVVAVGHALAYRELARARHVETSRIEARLARVRLQVLRMQLQPHFLFNTLNAVSALVREEPDPARRVLARLGDLLRRSLETCGRETVALAEELATLEDYLEIQQARFPDRLVVTWEIQPGVEAARVPPMLLQPLVENAVRHGIARHAGVGRITIGARHGDGRVELRVRDNGTGIPEGASGLREGIGLGSTRARLRDLYGPVHRFDLANAPGGGLEARIELPFRPTPPARRPRASAPGAQSTGVPAGRLRFLPSHGLVWVVIALAWAGAFVGQLLFLTGPQGGTIEPERLYLMAFQALLWTGFTAMILVVCERFPLARPLPRSLLAHLGANAGIFTLGMVLFVGMDELTGWAMWQSPEPSSAREKMLRFGYGASIDYAIRYWLVVGLAHALAYARFAEEDELRASQLEARLARTELQLLTVQLQPRFLLEALESISAVSERSALLAERMLARLSDLLRIVLESEDHGEISLQEELELLEPYLTLQQARFPDRLRVRRAVAADALDARVPGLVLQPLVDHAVRQALEGADSGSVEILARRRNGTLEVEVRGDGQAESAPVRESAAQALEATRIRLHRLYGAEHRLELEAPPGGSLRMALEIPFVESGAANPDPAGARGTPLQAEPPAARISRSAAREA